MNLIGIIEAVTKIAGAISGFSAVLKTITDLIKTSTEQKVREARDQQRQRVEDELDSLKKRPPVIPVIALAAFLVSCACDSSNIPGDSQRYLLDNRGARCEAPPVLRPTFEEGTDVSSMNAFGYFCRTPASEIMLRQAYVDCVIRLDECSKRP